MTRGLSGYPLSGQDDGTAKQPVRLRRKFVEPAANGEELDQARQDAASGLQQVSRAPLHSHFP